MASIYDELEAELVALQRDTERQRSERLQALLDEVKREIATKRPAQETLAWLRERLGSE